MVFTRHQNLTYTLALRQFAVKQGSGDDDVAVERRL